MASIRRDIVNRTDEVDIRAIDNGLKNPWRWNWLEKNVNGVYVREVIRKLRSCGVAYCLVCTKELLYGSRGLSALTKHMQGFRAPGKSGKVMENHGFRQWLKIVMESHEFPKKMYKNHGKRQAVMDSLGCKKEKKKKSLLRNFFFFVLRSVDLIDVSIHR